MLSLSQALLFHAILAGGTAGSAKWSGHCLYTVWRVVVFLLHQHLPSLCALPIDLRIGLGDTSPKVRLWFSKSKAKFTFG